MLPKKDRWNNKLLLIITFLLFWTQRRVFLSAGFQRYICFWFFFLTRKIGCCCRRNKKPSSRLPFGILYKDFQRYSFQFFSIFFRKIGSCCCGNNKTRPACLHWSPRSISRTNRDQKAGTFSNYKSEKKKARVMLPNRKKRAEPWFDCHCCWAQKTKPKKKKTKKK